jgi:hypothetical protein
MNKKNNPYLVEKSGAWQILLGVLKVLIETGENGTETAEKIGVSIQESYKERDIESLHIHAIGMTTLALYLSQAKIIMEAEKVLRPIAMTQLQEEAQH